MSMGGELSGGGEPLLEAGTAIGDSGLGKFGGVDLAAGGFDCWCIRSSLVYGLPPGTAELKLSCVCLYLFFCEPVWA